MGFQLPRQSLPLPVHLLLLLCVLPFLCHAVAPAKVKSDADFLFLTFSNGSASALDVNVVLGADYSAKKSAGLSMASQLDTKGAKQTKNKLKKRYSVLNQAPDIPSSGFGSFFSSSSSGEELTLLAAKTRALAASGTVEYKVDGITSGLMKSRPLFPKGKDKYQMKVCVFGDFAQNLYEQTEMNLSDLINKEQCVFNLFIGKASWERQLKPTPSFSFSPYVMLHSANASKHVAYARVPSIFGAVGGNQTETSFFYSTEVGDVAFIQITVEIATVADLQEGTEAYEMISQYFRELMLNELECKLQELHRRPKRPWIVLYMTHPYLVSNDEDKVQWLVMNDTSRFFEILKRYKVDLLTSCGIEGISRMLEAARVRMPEAKLPAYIQTTMAQCGGYPSVDISLQNECSYAVLDIRPDTMGYKKKGAETGGNVITSGNIERTFEKADDCVADDEL